MKHKRMLLSIDKHPGSSWIHAMQFASISEVPSGYVFNKETFRIGVDTICLQSGRIQRLQSRPDRGREVEECRSTAEYLVHRIPLFKFFLYESSKPPGYTLSPVMAGDINIPGLDPYEARPGKFVLEDTISDVGLADVQEVLLFLEAFKSADWYCGQVFQLQPGMLSSILMPWTQK